MWPIHIQGMQIFQQVHQCNGRYERRVCLHPTEHHQMNIVNSYYNTACFPGCVGPMTNVVHAKWINCPTGNQNHGKGKEGYSQPLHFSASPTLTTGYLQFMAHNLDVKITKTWSSRTLTFMPQDSNVTSSTCSRGIMMEMGLN